MSLKQSKSNPGAVSHAAHARKAFNAPRNSGHAQMASKAFGSKKVGNTGSGKAGC